MQKNAPFKPDVMNNIEVEIESYLKRQNSPHYAAFDADGTLWNIDAGEVFFEYQIKHSGLKNLPANPWQYYFDWKAKDPQGAYLWLAQINQGHELSRVRYWAKECLKLHPQWPLFTAQKKIIHWLKSKGIRVFVVTASIKWAVEPFAELLGLHYDDVIGVETKVENGIVTDQQNGFITWKEGKSRSLLERTQGVAPIFCSGNTMGDLALIECSQLIKMAVTSAKEGEELFETELALQKIAHEKNWLSHSFIEKP